MWRVVSALIVSTLIGCGSDDDQSICAPCETQLDCSETEICQRYKSIAEGEFRRFCIEKGLIREEWPPCTDCRPLIEEPDQFDDVCAFGPCGNVPPDRGAECLERCEFLREGCRDQPPSPFCNCLATIWAAPVPEESCVCDVDACFESCLEDICPSSSDRACQIRCFGMCSCENLNLTCAEFPNGGQIGLRGFQQ